MLALRQIKARLEAYNSNGNFKDLLFIYVDFSWDCELAPIDFFQYFVQLRVLPHASSDPT